MRRNVLSHFTILYCRKFKQTCLIALTFSNYKRKHKIYQSLTVVICTVKNTCPWSQRIWVFAVISHMQVTCPLNLAFLAYTNLSEIGILSKPMPGMQYIEHLYNVIDWVWMWGASLPRKPEENLAIMSKCSVAIGQVISSLRDIIDCNYKITTSSEAGHSPELLWLAMCI